jgi:hypothetical protein
MRSDRRYFAKSSHPKFRPRKATANLGLPGRCRHLGLREFHDCPEFGFEPCHYRTLLFEQRSDGPFDNNTEYAHGAFDAHATRFSPAIEKLLVANSTIEAAGLTFMPIPKPRERNTLDIVRQIAQRNLPLPRSP